MRPDTGNLGRNERLLSLGAGALLTALAARGGTFSKLIYGVGAMALLGRAAAGHCAMKAALNGESSLGQGFAQQWRHMKSGIQGGGMGTSRVSEATSAAEKAVREQGDDTSRSSQQGSRATGARVMPGTGEPVNSGPDFPLNPG